jgi:hypothetical protein
MSVTPLRAGLAVGSTVAPVDDSEPPLAVSNPADQEETGYTDHVRIETGHS